MEAGQLQRRSAAEVFSRRDVQLRRGFSCGGGSVVKAGQPRRRSAAEAGRSAAEAFSRGGVQLRRRSAAEAGRSAAEAFSRGGRPFSCGGVQPRRRSAA